jgi:hypothetical protein
MRDLGSEKKPIPNPGVKKAPDPGSASKERFLAVSLLVNFGDAAPALLPDPARTPGPVQPKKFGRWRKN